MNSQDFDAAASAAATARLDELRGMSFGDASALPWASIEDIVVVDKEVQLTVFQQNGLPDAPDAILVTIQLLRAGLGGTVNFKLERGLVFTADGNIREASEDELQATGST